MLTPLPLSCVIFTLATRTPAAQPALISISPSTNNHCLLILQRRGFIKETTASDHSQLATRTCQRQALSLFTWWDRGSPSQVKIARQSTGQRSSLAGPEVVTRPVQTGGGIPRRCFQFEDKILRNCSFCKWE